MNQYIFKSMEINWIRLWKQKQTTRFSNGLIFRRGAKLIGSQSRPCVRTQIKINLRDQKLNCLVHSEGPQGSLLNV